MSLSRQPTLRADALEEDPLLKSRRRRGALAQQTEVPNALQNSLGLKELEERHALETELIARRRDVDRALLSHLVADNRDIFPLVLELEGQGHHVWIPMGTLNG